MKKQNKLKTLVIDRRKWWRRASALAHDGDNRKMCCLGFLGKACGIPYRDMTYDGFFTATPMDAAVRKALPGKISYQKFLAFQDAAVAANDDPNVRGARREEHLTQIFKAVGVKLVFKG